MSPAWKLTAVLVVASAIADVALSRYGHAEFWWHGVPAFDLVFGFVGCAAIVLLSKWLGHELLMRDEDYYERDR